MSLRLDSEMGMQPPTSLKRWLEILSIISFQSAELYLFYLQLFFTWKFKTEVFIRNEHYYNNILKNRNIEILCKPSLYIFYALCKKQHYGSQT